MSGADAAVKVAKPCLKWAGGKTGLLPEILPRLPSKIRTYYEPFLGGGAVFFALAAEKRFDVAHLADTNSELILTYHAIARESGDVISLLRDHAKTHSESQYYRIRALDVLGLKKLRRPERAARLIYLNKTCFNGLYRVNKRGLFNTPFGDYKKCPTICDEANILAVSHTLGGAVLSALDFEAAVDGARKGDAAYFDPPYSPLSETSSFTSYTKDGFGPDDQERLRNVFRKLDERGVHVLLSSSDTPLVRKLYKGFRIEEVQARRAINSKGGKRGKIGELLILGRNSSLFEDRENWRSS